MQSFAGDRLGDGVLVGASAGLSVSSSGSPSGRCRCRRRASLSGSCLPARAALTAILASRTAHSQANDRNGTRRSGSHARIAPRMPSRALLGDIVAIAARQVQRPGDAADHRLVEPQQPRLRRASPRLARSIRRRFHRRRRGRAGRWRRPCSPSRTVGVALDDSPRSLARSNLLGARQTSQAGRRRSAATQANRRLSRRPRCARGRDAGALRGSP